MDQREQETVAAIEPVVRPDHAFGDVLRGLGFGLRSRAWEITCGVRPRTVLLLALALTLLAVALLAAGLLVAALRSSAAPLVWALGGCWAATLALAALVLRTRAADGRRVR